MAHAYWLVYRPVIRLGLSWFGQAGQSAYLVQFPAARHVWWHILCQGGKELHYVCRTSSACHWGTDPWSQLCEFSTRTKNHLSVRKLLGCGPRICFFLINIWIYIYIWCHDVAVLSQIDRRLVTGFSHVWLVWALTSFSSPKNVSSTVHIILWHCLYISVLGILFDKKPSCKSSLHHPSSNSMNRMELKLLLGLVYHPFLYHPFLVIHGR